MLVKLAWGNARRAARDFSVYFLTLAFAVCLLYSFLASGDYLLALSLTDAQSPLPPRCRPPSPSSSSASSPRGSRWQASAAGPSSSS